MVFIKSVVLIVLSGTSALRAQAAAIPRNVRSTMAPSQPIDSSVSADDRIYFGKMFIPIDNDDQGLIPRDSIDREHHMISEARGLLDGILGAVPGILQLVGGLVTDVTSALTNILGSILIAKPLASESYFMSASQTNSTTVYLQVVSNSAHTSNTSDLKVTLRMPMFDAANASMVDMCITYDPNPPMPLPMSITVCTDNVTDHISQEFLYEPTSGAVHPIFTTNSSSMSSSGDSSDAATMNGTAVMIFKPSVSTLPAPMTSTLSSHNGTEKHSSHSKNISSEHAHMAAAYPCVDPQFNASVAIAASR